jgi:hypothetical protein
VRSDAPRILSFATFEFTIKISCHLRWVVLQLCRLRGSATERSMEQCLHVA